MGGGRKERGAISSVRIVHQMDVRERWEESHQGLVELEWIRKAQREVSVHGFRIRV